MTKILLGETRREAISRVQERLGPATSRPLAEQTFWALAKRGNITMDPANGAYLIEDEIPDESIKDVASQINTKNEKRGIQYNVNRNHFHRARVAWNWNAAKQQSIFSPSLPPINSAEGQAPPPDDPPTD